MRFNSYLQTSSVWCHFLFDVSGMGAWPLFDRQMSGQFRCEAKAVCLWWMVRDKLLIRDLNDYLTLCVHVSVPLPAAPPCGGGGSAGGEGASNSSQVTSPKVQEWSDWLLTEKTKTLWMKVLLPASWGERARLGSRDPPLGHMTLVDEETKSWSQLMTEIL